MAENIFAEFVDWWFDEHSTSESLSFEVALTNAVKELGIIDSNEVIVSRLVEQDWFQDSGQTYMTIGSLELEGLERNRTVKVAAYAIVTPPPIPLQERAEIWRKRADTLAVNGVKIPTWYLIWKATIFTYYPPYSLLEYISQFELDNVELGYLAESLLTTFKNLAQLSLRPLGLLGSLRTNSFEVFYCGMGFDVGESGSDSPELLLSKYESEVLPNLPPEFKKEYFKYKE